MSNLKKCLYKLTANGHGLAMWRYLKSQPVTAAKFITKSSLFILLLGVIRRLDLKLDSEQKLSINSSPHHIAKPNVLRNGHAVIEKNHSFS
jgi:hypothetical protein